jgi:signal transduction histidine kinase
LAVEFTDITDRKKAEESLYKANRQINLLTGITRHDILNNVSAILSMLDLVSLKVTDDSVRDYIRKIETATTTIQTQIESTRIYESLGSHEPQWQDLDRIIPRICVPETITLKTRVQEIAVFADLMLDKVFFNLLDNSARHGEKVTEISLSYEQPGNDLTIVWEDNGIGIGPADKEKIFEQAYGKNTGLGLYLVRDILSLTGISIHETGVEGKGARFEIIVPEGGYRFRT